jgi:hypothetical protein
VARLPHTRGARLQWNHHRSSAGRCLEWNLARTPSSARRANRLPSGGTAADLRKGGVPSSGQAALGAYCLQLPHPAQVLQASRFGGTCWTARTGQCDRWHDPSTSRVSRSHQAGQYRAPSGRHRLSELCQVSRDIPNGEKFMSNVHQRSLRSRCYKPEGGAYMNTTHISPLSTSSQGQVSHPTIDLSYQITVCYTELLMFAP